MRAGPALGVLRPGDILSKVNGVSTSSMPGGFDEVVRHVAAGPRPLVAHFLQVILHGYGQEAQEAAAAAVLGAAVLVAVDMVPLRRRPSRPQKHEACSTTTTTIL